MNATTDATERQVPLEHLEHEICELSAHLSAAMCRWLLLVAEFDRRQGWGCPGRDVVRLLAEVALRPEPGVGP